MGDTEPRVAATTATTTTATATTNNNATTTTTTTTTTTAPAVCVHCGERLWQWGRFLTILLSSLVNKDPPPLSSTADVVVHAEGGWTPRCGCCCSPTTLKGLKGVPVVSLFRWTKKKDRKSGSKIGSSIAGVAARTASTTTWTENALLGLRTILVDIMDAVVPNMEFQERIQTGFVKSFWQFMHPTYSKVALLYMISIIVICAGVFTFLEEGMSFVDGLLLATGAFSQCGMSSRDLSTTSSTTNIWVAVTILLGSPIMQNVVPLLIRRFFFDPSKASRLDLLEHHAVCKLTNIILTYYYGAQVLTFFALTIWVIATPYAFTVLKETNNNVFGWTSFTSISGFQGNGMTTLPNSMVSFYAYPVPLLVLSTACMAGESLYPIILRFIIWTMSKCSVHYDRLAFQYLLENSRRVYTHMFPRTITIWLGIVVWCVNLIQFLFLTALNWNTLAFGFMTPGQKILNAYFMSTTTRRAGWVSINISDLDYGMLALYLGLMYLSTTPVVAAVRSSSTKAKTGLYHQARGLLTQDSVYVFILLVIIFSIENERIVTDTNFSPFAIMFELISAYGLEGLSFGYPGTNASFCSVWSNPAKYMICIAMILGRCRSFPDDDEPAVRIVQKITPEPMSNNPQRPPRPPSIATGHSSIVAEDYHPDEKDTVVLFSNPDSSAAPPVRQRSNMARTVSMTSIEPAPPAHYGGTVTAIYPYVVTPRPPSTVTITPNPPVLLDPDFLLGGQPATQTQLGPIPPPNLEITVEYDEKINNGAPFLVVRNADQEFESSSSSSSDESVSEPLSKALGARIKRVRTSDRLPIPVFRSVRGRQHGTAASGNNTMLHDDGHGGGDQRPSASPRTASFAQSASLRATSPDNAKLIRPTPTPARHPSPPILTLSAPSSDTAASASTSAEELHVMAPTSANDGAGTGAGTGTGVAKHTSNLLLGTAHRHRRRHRDNDTQHNVQLTGALLSSSSSSSDEAPLNRSGVNSLSSSDDDHDYDHDRHHHGTDDEDIPSRPASTMGARMQSKASTRKAKRSASSRGDTARRMDTKGPVEAVAVLDLRRPPSSMPSPSHDTSARASNTTSYFDYQPPSSSDATVHSLQPPQPYVHHNILTRAATLAAPQPQLPKHFPLRPLHMTRAATTSDDRRGVSAPPDVFGEEDDDGAEYFVRLNDTEPRTSSLTSPQPTPQHGRTRGNITLKLIEDDDDYEQRIDLIRILAPRKHGDPLARLADITSGVNTEAPTPRATSPDHS